MNIKVQGKHALVCGSTQGIGKAIAQSLAESGVKITLLARNENLLKETMTGLHGSGHQYLVADFTDFESLSKIKHEIENAQIDILINNAGGPPPGQLHEAKWQELDKAINMHLKASHHLTQWVVPHMKRISFGRIINIISTSVKIPIPGLGVSNTVRGAMGSWVKTLSNELGQYGITVNSLLPGFMNTVRLEAIIENQMKKTDKSREEVVEAMKATVPVRRFGEPHEIASLATYLCSVDSGYLNGLSIPIDGGRTGSI
jgi:3-oxoacyl-[acyl-carrier protein] reductase